MRLSDIKLLKNGDIIEFRRPFPELTRENKYKVRVAAQKKFILDDYGNEINLKDIILIRKHFKIINNE